MMKRVTLLMALLASTGMAQRGAPSDRAWTKDFRVAASA